MINGRVRKVLRTIPGYQFARRTYRSFREAEFRDREELQSWITTGMQLQQRLALEPIVFREGRAFVQSRKGLEFWWNPEVQGGALGLEFGSDFEKRELECVISHLAKIPNNDMVFIDIGANCGLYSLTVAQRFPKSHSYSFEPVPTSLAALSANVARNGFSDRITITGKALGDELKKVRMTASYSAMDHLVVGNGRDELSPLILEVPMVTLDTFVIEQGLQRVDFIKCDVEGAELLVFKGANVTLTRFHPSILLEIEPRHTKRFGYAPEDLDDFLRTFGYLPYKPDTANRLEKLTSISKGIAEGLNNFLYLPEIQ